MGEFKPTGAISEGQLDTSVEKPVSEADAMLLEKVLENSGIDARDLEDPNRAAEIEKMLNEEVEALASARPKSSLNELLRKGRKLGLPLITAAAILIGAGCAKEKDELPSENQQTSSRTIDNSNNENNNIIEIQEVGESVELKKAFFEALSEIEFRGAIHSARSKERLDLKKIDEVTIDNLNGGVHRGDWVNVTSDSNPANRYKALAMGVSFTMGGEAWSYPVESKSFKETGVFYEKRYYTKGILYEITYNSPSQHLRGYVIYPSISEKLESKVE